MEYNYSLEEVRIINIIENNNEIYFLAESEKTFCKCPKCNSVSNKIHSKYIRTIKDLPVKNKKVNINLITHKFFCLNSNCNLKIFTERFTFIESYKRVTNRMYEFIIKLGTLLSAEQASKLLKIFIMNISPDTILNILKSNAILINENFIHVGIDDFAFKKGQRYGTIFCNLETNKIIDIIEGRDFETIKSWLKKHPNIKIISRDGSITYSSAANEAIPDVIQISDRFHLIKNLIEASKEYIKRKYGSRIIINDETQETKIVETTDVSEKENNLSDSSKKKWEIILKVKEMYNKGFSQRKIAEELKLDRKTIKKYILTDKPLEYTRTKQKSLLDKYQKEIFDFINEGKNGLEIFNILKSKGYNGSYSTIRKHIKEIRINPRNTKECITLNKVIKLITSNEMSKKDRNLLDKLLEKQNEIKELYRLINNFKNIFKNKDVDALERFINDCDNLCIKEIISFKNGILRDINAVKNSIMYSYSNGLTEGLVNKLKTVKRQMYGRANIEILRKKLLLSQL